MRGTVTQGPAALKRGSSSLFGRPPGHSRAGGPTGSQVAADAHSPSPGPRHQAAPAILPSAALGEARLTSVSAVCGRTCKLFPPRRRRTPLAGPGPASSQEKERPLSWRPLHGVGGGHGPGRVTAPGGGPAAERRSARRRRGSPRRRAAGTPTPGPRVRSNCREDLRLTLRWTEAAPAGGGPRAGPARAPVTTRRPTPAPLAVADAGRPPPPRLPPALTAWETASPTCSHGRSHPHGADRCCSLNPPPGPGPRPFRYFRQRSCRRPLRLKRLELRGRRGLQTELFSGLKHPVGPELRRKWALRLGARRGAGTLRAGGWVRGCSRTWLPFALGICIHYE